MKTFEYYVEEMLAEDVLYKRIRVLGLEGWEMCGIEPPRLNDQIRTVYFKREICPAAD